jgi:RND family efflux transporter MFP subunit
MAIARSTLGLLGLAIALGCPPAGCQQKKGGGAPPAPALPQVDVERAIEKDVCDYEEFTGRTEAKKTVMIRSRVTGYLDQVLFKDGQEVEKDQPLFEIDPRLSKANLEAFEAATVQAEAHLKRLDDDFRRARNLFGTKAMSREDYDKISGDRAEADAALRKARADRLKASVDLAYCSIKSPIAGRVSRTFIDPHNLVKADDTMLTSIVSIDPIYAYFDVDERTFLRLNKLTLPADTSKGSIGQTAALATVEVGLADEFTMRKTPSGPQWEQAYPHKGTLNFRDNQLDMGTGTMRYRCEIPNPTGVLTPNLFVRIRLPIGTKRPVVLVPEQAIGTDQGQKFVFVVQQCGDEVCDVVYRAVKVGALQEGGYRVIHEGVAPDELVITNGLQRARPGHPVQKPVLPPAAVRKQ